MPRPGQIVPRAPEGSEHGATAALQRIAQAVPRASLAPAPAPAPPAPAPELVLEDDQNDGFDEVLFSPTERPDEPITAGVPFGPGPDIVRRPAETERAFMLRVAETLERSSVSAEIRAYIEAIRAGR